MEVDIGSSPVRKKKYKSRSGGDLRALTDPSQWILPFGNLMTILMIFFLILYAFAYHGGLEFEKTLAKLQKGVGGIDIKTQKKITETEIAGKLTEELKKYAKVEINAQRIKIFLPSPVLFESGKSDLKQEALNTLEEIAKSISPIPNRIIVEGHTDNIPVGAGKFSSNWELSAARAFSVIKYFIEQFKVSPQRFTAYGYGEFRPVALNDTEENRSKNRRIEISIIRM